MQAATRKKKYGYVMPRIFF